MLRDARRIETAENVLDAEVWASDWLGRSWLEAPLGERDAEQMLCLQEWRAGLAKSGPGHPTRAGTDGCPPGRWSRPPRYATTVDESAVKCDQVVSTPIDQLHEHCGWLLDAQELELHEAIRAAFDLV